ncbi:MAG: hypothetical protein J1F01_07425 [Oscillospiraceae bacterium]|nr:hypothetical protein [Oscillospiraceae bacterium]
MVEAKKLINYINKSKQNDNYDKGTKIFLSEREYAETKVLEAIAMGI